METELSLQSLLTSLRRIILRLMCDESRSDDSSLSHDESRSENGGDENVETKIMDTIVSQMEENNHENGSKIKIIILDFQPKSTYG